MRVHTFPCGCSWPILEEETPEGVLPLMDFDSDKVSENCPAVWKLLAGGHTKGVFQLESGLGRTWTKRLRPASIDHLGALTSVLRPGCLDALDDNGVSMTMHYCLRKNGEEPVESLHPVIDKVLRQTYSLILYQEELMSLAAEVALFTPKEVDKLRKAVGKKVQKDIAEVGKLFLEKSAQAAIIPQSLAERLWDWMKKSGKYLFNASHAMSYGQLGYKTAYVKAHFPLAFYLGWLESAHNEPDPRIEMAELVNDARTLGITIEPPSLLSPEAGFHTDRRVVRFGLTNIKGVGHAGYTQLRNVLSKLGSGFDWPTFLLRGATEVRADVMGALIQAGAFDWTRLPRRRLLAEYAAFSKLTGREHEWAVSSGLAFQNLSGLLRGVATPKKEGGAGPNAPRASLLRSEADLLDRPPSPLTDQPAWLASLEENFLGVPLTVSRVDGHDKQHANTTCGQISRGQQGSLVVVAEVKGVRPTKTKNGRSPGSPMCHLSLADTSGLLGDVVCFPESYKKYGPVLTDGNVVVVRLSRLRDGSLSVEWAGQAQTL